MSVVVVPAGGGPALPVVLGGLPPVHEVIVVVGAEEDAGVVLPRAARVIKQTRSGWGNAVACGAAVASGDVVVAMSGDGSCDPGDVPKLVAALKDGADVVVGSRGARLFDVVLVWVMRVLFGSRVSDPGLGFRAFRRDAAGRVGLPRVGGTEAVRGDGTEAGVLMVVRAGRAGLRVDEVGVGGRPGRGGAVVVPGVRALIAEYRRGGVGPVGVGGDESIVVMTGKVSGGPWPEPDVPRVPAVPERQGEAVRVVGPQVVERRRGERRRGDRRRGHVAVDRRGGVGEGLSRRRWRDAQGEVRRPDLRVIDGEGLGAKGDRGHLRSV